MVLSSHMNAYLFTQLEVLLNTWPVFDEFRKSFLIGEMIWNFADFQTGESLWFLLVPVKQSMS